METLDPSDVRFFSGSSHPRLAAAIAEYVGVPLDETHVRRFSNDNLFIQLGASVRSRGVYIIQSLSPPVNDHLVELLMMLDIAKGASAREIHASECRLPHAELLDGPRRVRGGLYACLTE